jgi:predicted small lipoprotein YifL
MIHKKEKRMKKITLALSFAVLLVTLSGCGDKPSKDSNIAPPPVET